MIDQPLPEIPKDAIKACIECFDSGEATERIAGYIEALIQDDRHYLKVLMQLDKMEIESKNPNQ